MSYLLNFTLRELVLSGIPKYVGIVLEGQGIDDSTDFVNRMAAAQMWVSGKLAETERTSTSNKSGSIFGKFSREW